MTMKPVFAEVVGQERAVAQLTAAAVAPVHAYLLVGPAGSGTAAAALAFAAAVLCQEGGCSVCSSCRHVAARSHADVLLVEREGASIRVGAVRDIVERAAMAPREGHRKVLVLTDFHLLQASQYPALLKTLEEPSASTVIVVTAEHLPEHLVTIASRCLRIDFGPIPQNLVASALEAEGIAPEVAAQVAAASNGNLDRARLLAGDAGFAARQSLWQSVPSRLDGTGATIATLVEQLLGAIETVLDPVQRQHEVEIAELEAAMRDHGERGSAKKALDDRHKREQRRVRQDELRSGLATLAAAYRDRLTAPGPEGRGAIDAVAAVQAAGEALIRNPNETLLLQGLLVRLTDAAAAA